MKFRTRNLVTTLTNSGFAEGTALPVKRNVFMRTGARIVCSIMSRLKKKNTYVEFVSALLIILFIYTGLNKMIDIEKFKFEMGRSPFIQNMSGIIAYTLPFFELVIAILLAVPSLRILGLGASFFLMTLFTGYVWLMLNKSFYLPCSCGGILNELSWEDHLIVNAFYTLLAGVGLWFKLKNIQ